MYGSILDKFYHSITFYEDFYSTMISSTQNLPSKKVFHFLLFKQTNLPAIPCTITFYHFFALLRHQYVNKVYLRYQGKEFLPCDDISAGFENWAVDIRRLKWTERLWSLSGHGCSQFIPNKIINYNEINK